MKTFRIDYYYMGYVVETIYKDFESIALAKDYAQSHLDENSRDAARIHFGDDFENFVELMSW